MVEFGREPHDSEAEGFDLESDSMFEQELRAHLRALPAPEGFANRVLARAAAVPKHETTAWPLRAIRNHLVRGVAAAMLLFSLGVGGYFEHRRERQIAGEHARQQVLLALRITGSTLQDVRNKVDGNSSNQQDAN